MAKIFSREVPVGVQLGSLPPGTYFTKAQDTDFCGQKSYFSGMSLVLRENSTVSAEPVLFRWSRISATTYVNMTTFNTTVGGNFKKIL